jgi:hypothetical protein
MEEENKNEIRDRRAEEVEALQAYYGDDLLPRWSSPATNRGAPPASSPIEASRQQSPPIDGPWFLRLRRPRSDANDKVDTGSGIGLDPSLEMRLPPSYPLGSDAPEPILHNVMMEPTSMRGLLRDLRDMYEPGMDVGILWGERCIEALDRGYMTCAFDSGGAREDEAVGGGGETEDGGGETTTLATNPGDGVEFDGAGRTRTFVPPNGTRYGQPTRHFPTDVVSARSKYRVRDITRTPPFKPPRSGPSELMMATVFGVTCVEHVQWALAELLFNDKKVSRAMHNMFAYRFASDDGTLVSDNDDDGEKGSGNKLASLLEMCRAENVLVVVSRWFGGVHLGSSRFKWIASVARDGLERGGFIKS